MCARTDTSAFQSKADTASLSPGHLLLTQCMDRLHFAREILLDVGNRSYVPGLFDRLAGRGLDGSTHAPLVSLADRLPSMLRATIWVIRLWVRI